MFLIQTWQKLEDQVQLVPKEMKEFQVRKDYLEFLDKKDPGVLLGLQVTLDLLVP